MKKPSLSVLFFLLLLLTLALSSCGQAANTASATHPASATPARTAVLHGGAGGSPDCSVTNSTGLSFDANSYTTDVAHVTIPFGFFSDTASDAPALGVRMCPGSAYIDLFVGNIRADSYKVRVTANGATTQTTLTTSPGNKGDQGYNEFFLNASDYPVPTNHQYSFQAQSCQLLVAPNIPSCSAWSPSLILTVVANATCQSGYVWRVATPFDLVCVTPAERTQVANDNNQASVRVDPHGAYGPHTCISGYVWRNAFGGDYVCVTPAERTQVANDNSQAFNRVVAF